MIRKIRRGSDIIGLQLPKCSPHRITSIYHNLKVMSRRFIKTYNPLVAISRWLRCKKIIRLLQNADPPTIVHELGHYFTMRYLDVLNKADRQEEATDMLKWLATTS